MIVVVMVIAAALDAKAIRVKVVEVTVRRTEASTIQ